MIQLMRLLYQEAKSKFLIVLLKDSKSLSVTGLLAIFEENLMDAN